jgi:AraC family transcriptional regulator, transcriptional activator of pobA
MQRFTLQQFYDTYFSDEIYKRGLVFPETGHFNVFKRGQYCKAPTQIHRSDFYKISLVIGSGILHLEGRSIEVSGHSLIFYNPAVPHLWESVSPKQDGYFCLFNAEFIKGILRDPYVRNSPLFNARLNPIFSLSEGQCEDLLFIFQKMMKEMESEYIHRYELIHNYIQVILHEANKSQNVYMSSGKYANAASRIVSLFIELLERQFPVDSTERSLKFKTPHDFAEHLSVHVNHLNRAVKEITGSSTSEIVAARIAAEAQSLLLHSDNTVAEIAYSLGFEHPSNFNIFFKKHTGKTPKSVRDLARRKQSIPA